MPDDTKAKKLAAARKKLKAYQAKSKGESGNNEVERTITPVSDGGQSRTEEDAEEPRPSVCSSEPSLTKSTASSFDSETIPFNGNHAAVPQTVQQIEHFSMPLASEAAHASTIELLINEKAHLCSELAHYKAECMEKTLAAEEANVRLHDVTKRVERLEKDLKAYQSQNVEEHSNAERASALLAQANGEVAKLKEENVEFKDHIDELKETIKKQTEKMKQLEDRIKENDCELELNKIRINQISDVASVENDSKVEVLTQQKFMHEQQIRDLQSMVQQLETERDQSSQQYQSYVQHLNREIATLKEKDAKQESENRALISRERGLIEHVGKLERQLQNLIATKTKLQAVQEDSQKNFTENEVNEKLKNVTEEKTALNEKCQTQEKQIAELERLIQEKLTIIEQFEDRMENFSTIQSDSTKLLARVESDGIAASRAVAQNEQLKTQLDEVQMKLIQVTNDKVELTNELDAERFSNREIRSTFEKMEKQISELSEKLHFKDEEMIRLTKENTELSERIAGETIQNGSYSNEQHSHEDCSSEEDKHEHGHNAHDHDHSHDHDHDKDHDHEHDHNHGHDHDHDDHHHHHHDHKSRSIPKSDEIARPLPQSEAMRKLEQRFNSLMSDVANLTDEKQRLEHLVMQLQGETDTIGEYIALYQAQRRVLKQREIERNTQLHKLKTEREDLHNKISLLNQLVNNLSQQHHQEIPFVASKIPPTGLQPATTGSIENTIESNTSTTTPTTELESLANNKQLNSSEIIDAIKNIVVDLKNNEQFENDLNFVPALDHCSCCSGKFETI